MVNVVLFEVELPNDPGPLCDHELNTWLGGGAFAEIDALPPAEYHPLPDPLLTVRYGLTVRLYGPAFPEVCQLLSPHFAT